MKKDGEVINIKIPFTKDVEHFHMHGKKLQNACNSKSCIAFLIQCWVCETMNRLQINYKLRLLCNFRGSDEDLFAGKNGGYRTGISQNPTNPGFFSDCREFLQELSDIVPKEFLFSTFVSNVRENKYNLDGIQSLKASVQSAIPATVTVSPSGEASTSKRKKRKRKKKSGISEDEEEEDESVFLTSPRAAKKPKTTPSSELSKKDLRMWSTMFKNIQGLREGLLSTTQINEMLGFLIEKDAVKGVIVDETKLGKILLETNPSDLPLGLKELDNVRKCASTSKAEFTAKHKAYQQDKGSPPPIGREKWKDSQYIQEGISIRSKDIAGIPFPPYPSRGIFTRNSDGWDIFHSATDTDMSGKPTKQSQEAIAALRLKKTLPQVGTSFKRRPSIVESNILSQPDDALNVRGVNLENAFNTAYSREIELSTTEDGTKEDAPSNNNHTMASNSVQNTPTPNQVTTDLTNQEDNMEIDTSATEQKSPTNNHEENKHPDSTDVNGTQNATTTDSANARKDMGIDSTAPPTDDKDKTNNELQVAPESSNNEDQEQQQSEGDITHKIADEQRENENSTEDEEEQEEEEEEEETKAQPDQPHNNNDMSEEGEVEANRDSDMTDAEEEASPKTNNDEEEDEALVDDADETDEDDVPINDLTKEGKQLLEATDESEGSNNDKQNKKKPPKVTIRTSPRNHRR